MSAAGGPVEVSRLQDSTNPSPTPRRIDAFRDRYAACRSVDELYMADRGRRADPQMSRVSAMVPRPPVCASPDDAECQRILYRKAGTAAASHAAVEACIRRPAQRSRAAA